MKKDCKSTVALVVVIIVAILLLKSCKEAFGAVLDYNPCLQGKSGVVRHSMADRIAYRDLYSEKHWKENQKYRSDEANWTW